MPLPPPVMSATLPSSRPIRPPARPSGRGAYARATCLSSGTRATEGSQGWPWNSWCWRASDAIRSTGRPPRSSSRGPGEPMAEVAEAGPEDAKRAVDVAHRAFEEGAWRRMSATRARARPAPRLGPVARAARGLRRRRVAERRQADQRRPRRDRDRRERPRVLGRRGEQDLRGDDPRAGPGPRHHAPGARRRVRAHHAVELPARDRVVEDRSVARVREHDRREAGDATRRSPSCMLADLLVEAGLPPETISVLPGPGLDRRRRRSSRIRASSKVGFTGSTAVGRADHAAVRRQHHAGLARARRQVGERRVRRRRHGGHASSGRCGRSSTTPARTARRARACSCSARSTTSSSRRMAKRTAELRVGMPQDEATDLGPDDLGRASGRPRSTTSGSGSRRARDS